MRKEDKKKFVELCSLFKGKRILVIGDLMVDEFIWGDVERISPEAPVPVVHFKSDSLHLGGAANVAGNLRDLGAEVVLAGVVGDDPNGHIFHRLCDEQIIDTSTIVTETSRNTTVKTRIIANNQQVVRLDREQTNDLRGATRNRLLQLIENQITDLDGVIISDYSKGVITASFMNGFRKLTNGRKLVVAVDPQVNNTRFYRNMTIITPNHHEAGAALGRKLMNDEDIIWAGKSLLRKLQLQAVLITLGEKGMTLFLADDNISHIPTVAREVYDVTGAGDTVVATLTLALAAGATMEQSAVIANFAASIVVSEIGTATVPVRQLIKTIRSASLGE